MVNKRGKIPGVKSRYIGIPMFLCLYYSMADGIKMQFRVDVLFVRFGRRSWGRKRNDEFYIKILWPFWVLLAVNVLLILSGAQ